MHEKSENVPSVSPSTTLHFHHSTTPTPVKHSATVLEAVGIPLVTGCKMRGVNDGPELISSTPARERNWMPLVIAAAAVVVIVAVIVVISERGRNAATVAPVNAPADAYAVSLPISNL